MQVTNTTESGQAKTIDPIWKILHVTRIICAVWLLAILIFIFILVRDQGIDVFGPGILALIYGIFPIIIQFTQERRWNGIAQRRAQALYHPETLLTSVLSRPTSDASDLQLPLHIQLRQSGKMRVLLVIFLIIMLIVGVALGLFSSGSSKPIHLVPLLIVFGSIIAVLLIVLVLFFFIQARYLAQTFDITAEGMTTRYLNQQRSIRWNEVRVFARYSARGWNSAAFGNMYELANEHTVVRWVQRTSIGIAIKSNQPEHDDLNWLMGQINTLVMARSGQPLLNLDEKRAPKQRPTSKLAEVAAMPGDTPLLGQDDPIISKITAGSSKKSALIFGALGIVIIIVGALLQYFSDSNNPFSSALLFRYGAFMLLLALLCLLIIPRTQRYWLSVQKRRQFAVQDPEHGLATPQPVPGQQQPQPAQLYISTGIRGKKQAFRTFGLVFLFFLIIAELIAFSLDPLHQLFIIIGCLLLGCISLGFGFLTKNKSTMQRIDISSNGIGSHYISNDTQINWQDARLFATYKSFKLLNIGAPASQIYELVGEQAVVRWAKQAMPIKAITTEPAMSVEEYERWLEHLHSYITKNTQLPLYDLDK